MLRRAILPSPLSAIAFAAGIAGGFAFAPWNLAPLMIASLAVLLWLLERLARQYAAEGATRGAAFRLGWSWGMGNFLIGQFWIAQAFQFQAKMPASLGWAAVVVLSAIMALYPGVSAAIAIRFRRRAAARAFAFAGTWMLTEWLRGYLFSGFGWNPLGVVTLPIGDLAQAAAIIGTLGLSGVLALAAYGIALSAHGRWRPGLAMAVPVGLVALIPVVPADPTPATDIRLDIVQANIGQDEKYGPDAVQTAITRHALLTPPPGQGPRLLIWPEAAIPDLLDELPQTRTDLGAALLGPDDLFILGGLKALRGADGRIEAAHNSLFVLERSGAIVDRYDKTILVPYGEYLPARPLLEAIGLARLAPGAIDFVPGEGARTLRLPGFRDVGAMICYEVVYPEAASSAPRPGWLLNLSNDAWFTDEGAEMHLAQARMRAIEQGLPMARATPTGISAVIDPWGRITASLGRNSAGRIITPLPTARAATPFARLGTPLPIGLALLFLIAAFAMAQPSRVDEMGPAQS